MMPINADGCASKCLFVRACQPRVVVIVLVCARVLVHLPLAGVLSGVMCVRCGLAASVCGGFERVGARAFVHVF